MAARIRASQSQQQLDVFTERVESGLKDPERRQEEQGQLEKSLGAKAQEAKDRIMERAAEQLRGQTT